MNRQFLLLFLFLNVAPNASAMDLHAPKKDASPSQDLIKAVSDGDAKKVASLIAAKADINQHFLVGQPGQFSSGEWFTPLKLAVTSNKQEIVSLLLEAGADDSLYGVYNLGDPYGFIPHQAKNGLHNSYALYADKTCQKIQEAWPRMPQGIVSLICSKLWITGEDRALVNAINAGDHKQAQLLLRAGADPNVLSYFGPSLYAAATSTTTKTNEEDITKDQVKMMDLLLKSGASPDQVTVSKVPVLYMLISFAGANPPLEQIKLLLKHNADTEIVDPDNKRFVDYAQKYPEVMAAYNAQR